MKYNGMNDCVGLESVGLKSCAVGRSAYRPPSWTKNKTNTRAFSLSAKAHTRRPRPIAQEFIPTLSNPTLLLLAAALLLLTLPAQAKGTAPALEISRIQAQAFGLGYALRTADLQAVAYTKSIQQLKDVSDPQVAGAEVAHFSSEVLRLRRAEAASYTLTASLLSQMGAPASLRLWATQSVAALNAPLVYSNDAKKLAKTEPDTAAVSAELTEIQEIKAAADAQQTPMTLWLELTGGKVTPWTANVGAYAAELHRASHAASPSPLSSITARILLRHAPPGAPAATRESLATLIPSGGGNLQNLATIAPANITSDKITHVYETLLTLYNAEGQAQTLDKSAS
jgi:hypothetical protein